MRLNILTIIGLAAVGQSAVLPVADVGLTPRAELEDRQLGLGILGIATSAPQCAAGSNTVSLGNCIATSSLTITPAVNALTSIVGIATGILGTVLNVISIFAPVGTGTTGPVNVLLYPDANCAGQPVGYFSLSPNICTSILGFAPLNLGFIVSGTAPVAGLPVVSTLTGIL